MGMKFLNKKGWHTGSLRNIENVWKAEQKHDAEQKKLEELRKQILEEREKSEFRLLQEQAGLVPRQERLEFLYDSGLAVGKGSSDGFKALETLPKTHPEAASSSSAKQPQQPSVPGALFEEKPQSANDTWRKLHSDPLLLIRQREQEALARVKNNPVQMAMIRKSVEAKKHKDKTPDGEEHQKKPHRKKSKHRKHSSPKLDSNLKNDSDEEGEGERRSTNSRKSFKHDEHLSEESRERDIGRRKNSDMGPNYKKQRHSEISEPNAEQSEDKDRAKRDHDKSKREKYHTEDGTRYESSRRGRERNSPDRASRHELNHKRGNGRVKLSEEEGAEPKAEESEDKDRTKRNHEKYHMEGWTNYEFSRRGREHNSPDRTSRHDLNHKRGNGRVKLSEEERAARLREMQEDAEIHEEQRWKRLKKAEEDDAREASRAGTTSGKNFLDAAQKSVYGAEKGGSSTIEESVRRRTHYSQGRSQVGEGNAFRR